MSFRIESRLGRLEKAAAFTLARKAVKLRLGHRIRLGGDVLRQLIEMAFRNHNG